MTKKVTISRNAPCEAVLLLVQRMESHPDEFALNSTSKWHGLLEVLKRRVVDRDSNALLILDDFETEMLWGKFKAAGRKSLHAFVMKKILEKEEDDE